ncbi:NnrS family protein [Stappia sp. F7233]|uniref:NnrS family protein n=1 Tax=Stappia albiluteola TaxID=2758565 RepID=A0A839A9S8_9HYPH|nr:NnrS family protein [Stappia albiluteola]MBA5775702.1 NnrS family protein [Stappia albiluteola]
MTGPYWLSGGFRPFFLLGALAMAVSVLVWIPVYFWGLELPTTLSPRDWHVHALIFGGVMAIIAGFALTAVSNWTGRPPVAGMELFALVMFWAFGRAAVSSSAIIGPNVAMVADLLFPAALVAVFAREVIAAGNYRNLRIVAVVAALGLANLAFHLEAGVTGAADNSLRASVGLVVLLVMLIGGRIVPAFTRNWLAARKEARLPVPFSRFDAVSVLVGGLALATWAAFPEAPATAAALALAGLLSAVRLARWRGLGTRADPLLLILHIAFATIPAGFLAIAASILLPGAVDPVAAVHVWTVGTFGTMTLAVMTRASRGHSGQALAAGALEIAIFALVLLGAAARVAAPYAGGWMVHAIECAGLTWAGAYLLFTLGYGRMLLARPKLS